jgi:hypothetical protein
MNRFCHFAVVSVVAVVAGCVPTTVVPPPDETIMQKEINAAAAMDMESNREGALAAVVTRQDLSQSDQVYVVKTIYGRLQTDQTKVNLLRSLIQNPQFGNAAKGVVLDGMKDGFKEDIARRQVLQLLQEKGPIDDEVAQRDAATTRRAAERKFMPMR